MPPASRARARTAAFFDMDKTLISENSGVLYMKHRYQRGEVTAWDLLRELGPYLRYKAGILDIRAWTKQQMTQFRGQSERALAREARRWFDEMVVGTVYPEAEETVQHHQQEGHVVAIVSGATKFVVKPLAERLGVRHYLYTRLEVEHGRFTGRVVEPICFEEGKIYWLQQFIDQHRIDLAKSYFYTDSITDLPLLDLVGHPVAVNPDPFLYRKALRRRWPVRFFTPPDPRAHERSRDERAPAPAPAQASLD